ncbi:unnamed protein product, partial [Allacma fusca]
MPTSNSFDIAPRLTRSSKVPVQMNRSVSQGGVRYGDVLTDQGLTIIENGLGSSTVYNGPLHEGMIRDKNNNGVDPTSPNRRSTLDLSSMCSSVSSALGLNGESGDGTKGANSFSYMTKNTMAENVSHAKGYLPTDETNSSMSNNNPTGSANVQQVSIRRIRVDSRRQQLSGIPNSNPKSRSGSSSSSSPVVIESEPSTPSSSFFPSGNNHAVQTHNQGLGREKDSSLRKSFIGGFGRKKKKDKEKEKEKDK